MLMFVPDVIPLIISNDSPDFSEFENEIIKYFDSCKEIQQQHNNKDTTVTKRSKYFVFDPNTASYENLLKLGLKYKTVNTIKKYLAAGGNFFKKTDMLKIYGIDSDKYEKIEPYIVIQEKAIAKKSEKTVIEINSTDSVKLKLIRGIGPVLAGRIIRFRNLLGGFISKEQLKEVYGIRKELYEEIKNSVFVDTSLVRKLDINFATFREILRHPYINYSTARNIVNYRTENGIFINIEQIENQIVIADSLFIRLKPYIMLEKKFE